MNPDSTKFSAEMAQSVKRMAENMPALLEICRLEASLLRARHQALIRAGFTPDEALRICVKG